jgi:hypothetical protein
MDSSGLVGRVAPTTVVALCLVLTAAPAAQVSVVRARDSITEASVLGHMEMLASDALNGRASGSRDEWITATYIASQLRRAGLEPLGDNGSFVKEIEVPPSSGRGTPSPSESPAAPPPRRRTWNVIAQIPGRADAHERDAILLSAHLDHLGARGQGDDIIYNGADDDASGTTAVLELAMALARTNPPRRTLIFAWFGSEEAGGYGSRDFVEHPPVPLERIVANLQFEMIGRPDPTVAPGTLWLTGYDRSDLGLALARQGAMIVADPHPAQNFFFRSDNIQFAYAGVVAHTISSFGLHADYHRPSDEVSRIDIAHMTRAIQSLVAPVRWLASSSYTPAWRTNGRPIRGQR